MKKSIGLIFALALLWCLLWGSFAVYVIASGLMIGTLIAIGVGRTGVPWPIFGLRWLTLPRFALYFLKLLVLSNLQVARIVLRPGFHESPRIVRLDVAELTPAQTTTLASVITLTPGTLSLDVSEDGHWLYVHCLIGHDRDAIERDLAEIKQRLKSEVFR